MSVVSHPIELSQPVPEYVRGASGTKAIQAIGIPRYWNMSDQEAGECVIKRFEVVPYEIYYTPDYQMFRVVDELQFARVQNMVNPIDVKIVYGHYA